MEEIKSRHKIYQKLAPIFDYGQKTVQIPLRNRKSECVGYALADLDDAEMLLQKSFNLHTSKDGFQYAKSGKVGMHMLLLGKKKGFIVDHINGDKLDNRRINLRFATRKQNAENKPKKENCTTHYIGVHASSRNKNKWEVSATTNEGRLYIGVYDDPKQAAIMYDIYTIATFGSQARTNNLLDADEIEYIVANGVPKELQKVKKERVLPKGIKKNRSGTFTASKIFDRKTTNKTFETLEEAQNWLDEFTKECERIKHERKIAERRFKQLEDGTFALIIRKGEEYVDVLVDEECLHDLRNYSWSISKNNFIQRHAPGEETMMHRYLWKKYKGDIPENLTVDHKNQNRLDHRMCNLRLATWDIQNHNKEKYGKGFDIYPNVRYDGKNFSVMVRNVYIGCYPTAEEGAQAVNDYNIKEYGDQAKLIEIDWSKKTTAENRMTVDMIDRELIENLETRWDVVNVAKVFGLTRRQGGPVNVKGFRAADVENFKTWLIKTRFSGEDNQPDLQPNF